MKKNILVVFGSKSDESVYGPLINKLEKNHQVRFEVLSAHRNPVELEHLLKSTSFDLIVAGAGLAAHLPGVVASKVKTPVLGIPVNSVMQGLDSLLSTQQMPFGVSVLSSGPNKTDEIVNFINHYSNMPKFKEINIIFKGARDNPDYQKEIDRTLKLAEDKNLPVTMTDQYDDNKFNIALVTKDSEIFTDKLLIHVPLLTSEQKKNPETALTLLNWTSQAGLWVGTNNTRNALLFYEKLYSFLPEILFCGSVKTVRGKNCESPYVFEFTDDYSIFDWGKMPDTIHKKGQALTFMSTLFFDLLGNKDEWNHWNCPDYIKNNKTYERIINEGVAHHFLGKVDERMNQLEVSNLSRFLKVKPVNIIKPESSSSNNILTWNYSPYKDKPTNTLIPLEVIFRFDIPSGSSLLERAKDMKYLKGIGLENSPQEGDSYETPIIEFSTKLETKDRYISYNEAKEIACLSDEEFEDLHKLTTLLALRLKSYFQETGIKLSDGKFEYAWNENRIPMLVDVITPDELRISYKGKSLSKENIRRAYRGSDWHNKVKESKEIAHRRGEKDWKGVCINELKSLPPKLNQEDKDKFSMIYQSIANALSEKTIGKTIFDNAWDLDQLISKL